MILPAGNLKCGSIDIDITKSRRRSILDQSHSDDDDDDSACSTVEVDGFDKSAITADMEDSANNARRRTTSTSSKKKGVYFNEDANELYADSFVQNKTDFKQERWYSRADIRIFKTELKFTTTQIEKYEEQHKQKSNPMSYQRLLLKAYEACCEQYQGAPELFENGTLNTVLTVKEEERLRRWMTMSTTRLGLERASTPTINTDRADRRKQYVQVVLDIQDELEMMKRLGISTLPTRKTSLCFHQVCQAISGPSRVFAHQLARVQAEDSEALTSYDVVVDI